MAKTRIHIRDIDSLKPVPLTIAGNAIYVEAGTFLKSTGVGTYTYAGGTSPSFDVIINPSFTRIDVISIDDVGTLHLQKGTEALSPTPPTPYTPDYLPIAEVTVDDTAITTSLGIKDVRPFLNLGGSGGGTPGGLNTEIQFNDGGSFNGAAYVEYNKYTGVLTVSSVTVGNLNVSITATINYLYANGSNISVSLNGSVIGTSNQVNVSNNVNSVSGTITLSLPQSIAYNSPVQFGSLLVATISCTQTATINYLYASTEKIVNSTIGNLTVTSTATINYLYATSSNLQYPLTGSVVGTANQVNVSSNLNSVASTITLSLPQSIAINSNVQFGSLLVATLSVTQTATINYLYAISSNLQYPLTGSVVGTTNQVNVSTNLNSVSQTITLSLPQDIDTSASVQFGGVSATTIYSGQIGPNINSAWEMPTYAHSDGLFYQIGDGLSFPNLGITGDSEVVPGIGLSTNNLNVTTSATINNIYVNTESIGNLTVTLTATISNLIISNSISGEGVVIEGITAPGYAANADSAEVAGTANFASELTSNAIDEVTIFLNGSNKIAVTPTLNLSNLNVSVTATINYLYVNTESIGNLTVTQTATINYLYVNTKTQIGSTTATLQVGTNTYVTTTGSTLPGIVVLGAAGANDAVYINGKVGVQLLAATATLGNGTGGITFGSNWGAVSQIYPSPSDIKALRLYGSLEIERQKELRFFPLSPISPSYVGFKCAPTITATATVIWQLPSADGLANQTIITNGAGVLSFTTITASSASDLTGGNAGDLYVSNGSGPGSWNPQSAIYAGLADTATTALSANALNGANAYGVASLAATSFIIATTMSVAATVSVGYLYVNTGIQASTISVSSTATVGYLYAYGSNIVSSNPVMATLSVTQTATINYLYAYGSNITGGKVQVTSTDTTADYLSNKLVAGVGITITVNAIAGYQTMTIANTIANAIYDEDYVIGTSLNNYSGSTTTVTVANASTTTTDKIEVYYGGQFVAATTDYTTSNNGGYIVIAFVTARVSGQNLHIRIIKATSITDADTVDGQHATALQPTGAIQMFGGAAAPTGWVLCDGTSYARTGGTYDALFAVIGTTFGNVDGSHFNVPDMRGVYPKGAGTTGRAAGKDAAGNYYTETLGAYVTDKFQGHFHNWYADLTGSGDSGLQINDSSVNYLADDRAQVKQACADGTNGTPRTGLTTEPQHLGLTYIIKL